MSRYVPNEAVCPVPLEMLALLMRSDPAQASDVVSGLGPEHRATLALYCFGRNHLRTLGLLIARHCSAQTLQKIGGTAGAMLFEHTQNPDLVLETKGRDYRKPVTLPRFAA